MRWPRPRGLPRAAPVRRRLDAPQRWEQAPRRAGHAPGSRLRPPSSPCTLLPVRPPPAAPRDHGSSCCAGCASSGRCSPAGEQEPPAVLSRDELPRRSANRDFTQYGTCPREGGEEGEGREEQFSREESSSWTPEEGAWRRLRAGRQAGKEKVSRQRRPRAPRGGRRGKCPVKVDSDSVAERAKGSLNRGQSPPAAEHLRSGTPRRQEIIALKRRERFCPESCCIPIYSRTYSLLLGILIKSILKVMISPA